MCGREWLQSGSRSLHCLHRLSYLATSSLGFRHDWICKGQVCNQHCRFKSYPTREEYELVAALGSTDTRRLKQLKQSLTEKLSVLSALDDEIIALIEDEQLEAEVEQAEVEQADLIRGKVNLAVISIDDTLETLVALAKGGSHEGRKDSCSGETSPSGSSGDEGHSATPRTLSVTVGSPGTTHSDTPPATTTHSVSPLSASAPCTDLSISAVPFSFTPTFSFASIPAPLSYSTVSTTPLVTTLPVPPSVMSSGPLTSTVSFGHGEPRSVGVYSVPPHSVSSICPGVMASYAPPPLVPTMAPYSPSTHTIVPQVKLPKLSIRKFNGALTKWVTFWDSFNSSIHANPTLSSIDKINYLISLLESSAAEAIAGLSLTAANYDEAVATLKGFGNPQLIVNRHMEALLSVTAISSQNDFQGLRKLHNSVEAHIRGLRALGVPTETYGGLLTLVLVNKLPPEVKLIVSRELTGENWDLDRVMKILEAHHGQWQPTNLHYLSSQR